MSSPHKLYRLYDAADALLYVGISRQIEKRLKTHARHSPWGGDVDRIEIEDYPDRPSAELAEALAIRRENPRHNRLVILPARAPRKPRTKSQLPIVRLPLYGLIGEGARQEAAEIGIRIQDLIIRVLATRYLGHLDASHNLRREQQVVGSLW